MKLEQDWIDNSSADAAQFDYFPAGGWTDPAVAAAQASFAALIGGAAADGDAPGWLRLIRGMPEALRGALTAELRAGNYVTAVGSSGWPDPGSVVVNLRDRFTVARYDAPHGVVWRELNDPRYAREEVMQRHASTSHLLIT